MSSAPSCKSDLQYNFALATGRDALVYGAARPGAKGQRCFDPNDKVNEDEVRQWADYVKSHGVKRVVALLTRSEREETYVAPPLEALRAAGLQAENIDVEEDPVGGTNAVVQLLEEAIKADEKVVLHCWGGGGRTGRLLAAFLVRHYGITPEEAAEEVAGYAKQQGASRRVDVAQLKKDLGM